MAGYVGGIVPLLTTLCGERGAGQVNLPQKIRDSIIELSAKYTDVKKVVLFGSRARGDNGERSDVDLAIYFTGKRNIHFISDIDDIDTLLKIDITVMGGGLDDKFVKGVEEDGVVIYMKKFLNKFDNLKKSVARLEEVVEMYTPGNDLIRDSIIQRFEFTYELAWKSIKEYLAYNGLVCEGLPRSVFKAAFSAGIIDDEEVWLNMIRDRNVASHEYNEGYINQICEKVRIQYLATIKGLVQKLDPNRGQIVCDFSQ